VLLLRYVVLAKEFGLEAILGALLARVVIGAVDRDTAAHRTSAPSSTRSGSASVAPGLPEIQQSDAG
jgi:hypothetical protein